MQAYERTDYRRELEVAMLPFRLVRKRKGKKGWVRSVREATGMPVEELARRLGVQRWAIRRLEVSEENSRILLGNLRRAAEGLGCELVYALVPKQGTLEDLAAEHEGVRERALEKKRAARQAGKDSFLEFIGWRETFRKAMQTILRSEGYRVRPRTTNRGDEENMAQFERNIGMLKMAGLLGPFMKKFMEEQGTKDKGQ
jgi:predicted DNA-binding mobile mystery protein A